MIRVELAPAQRAELRARARAPGLAPRERARLETVALADAGWSVPRIAGHLGVHEQTVRRHAKGFLAGGFAAPADRRPRPGRPPRVTAAHLDALGARLDAGGRTRATPQLAARLARGRGVRVHPGHLGRLLHGRGFAWKRAMHSVAHERRGAAAYGAKVAELDGLKKRRATA